MENFLLENQFTLHNNIFFGLLLIVVVFEVLFPLRSLFVSMRPRWTANFLLGALSYALERTLIPIVGITVAFYASENGLGIFNSINVSPVFSIVISVLVLDLVNYWQHRLFHQVSWLWNVHKVHHSDPEVDFSTTFRFHPLETLFSPLFIAITVIILGAPASGVIIYTVLIVALSFVSHANIRFPYAVDRIFGLIIITPYLHRLHHSAKQSATDSNYGTIFSFWDRLFNSFTASDSMDQSSMKLGLDEMREDKHQNFLRLLMTPFVSQKSNPQFQRQAQNID